jgi:hypothetical protein
MAYPTIIAGPAIITHNSQTYYTEGDITLRHTRQTFPVQSALGGTIDQRLVSQMTEISFKPVGALDVAAKYIPYAASQIGSLLIDQAVPKSVVIWAKDGVKNTWGNGFVSGLPSFTLGANKTAIGSEMKITCFADPTKTLVHASAWNAITAAALADTSFDETKIVTPAWTAAFGSSPYNAMESEDGFTFEVAMAMRVIPLANYGNVNALLTDLTARVRFVPANLTEAQIWTLLNLQDAAAIVPGMSVASATDLIISAGGLSFTLYKAGPTDASTHYGLTALRQGEIAFEQKKTWTTGAINPIVAFDFTA